MPEKAKAEAGATCSVMVTRELHALRPLDRKNAQDVESLARLCGRDTLAYAVPLVAITYALVLLGIQSGFTFGAATCRYLCYNNA